MKITPRAAELKHVGEAIDKDYKTLSEASRAAIKAVSESLDLRDWWTVVAPKATEHGNPILMGLYDTELAATKAKDKLLSTTAFDGLFIWPITSMAPVFASMSGEPTGDDCECGHKKVLHLANGVARVGCGLSFCECEKYKAGDHPIPKFPTCASCRQPVLA